MSERLARFVGLSVVLTGVGAVRLLGTGVGESYLTFLDAVLPPTFLDILMETVASLPAGPDAERMVAARVMADPRLGPVARNIIVLWYCGTWSPLPDAWRAAFGASPLDTKQLVSGAAYQAGLQWIVAGAHAAGAAPQGYGAWAEGPSGWAP